MKKVYVVTSGDYSDYKIDRIFENLDDAEKFCAIQNDSGTSDPCNIEFWDLTESGTFQKAECHKAILGSFLRLKNSGYIGSITWSMGFSKEPVSFNCKCVDNRVYAGDAERWEVVIPVMHTYNRCNINDDSVVEKIVRDSYYMWRAMEEGIY